MPQVLLKENEGNESGVGGLRSCYLHRVFISARRRNQEGNLHRHWGKACSTGKGSCTALGKALIGRHSAGCTVPWGTLL